MATRKALGWAYYHLDETAERDVVASHRIRVRMEEDIESKIGSPITVTTKYFFLEI